MEPLTAGAIPTERFAIAFLALLGEKTLEKTVEISIGKAFDYVLKLLKRKSPETAADIEAAAADEEIKVALEDLAANAKTANPELEKAIQELIEIVKTQCQTTPVENWQGINTKGGTVNISSPQFNFGQK
ncbi:hypothetical protein [Anabaena catenula]|uniref:Uncharacterized protein n=1 Tax=Anabaena catenula FACHB-362 TaxID=2692877 RepID=A0ABR8IXQ7_9NOST|nr:hypothetical protein [Anabaena catenula]MBD2690842.1 hypothetical protein [Anabaena catenula FACHB-362]